MKERVGWVSNSSTSSFVISIDKDITTKEELKKFLQFDKIMEDLNDEDREYYKEAFESCVDDIVQHINLYKERPECFDFESELAKLLSMSEKMTVIEYLASKDNIYNSSCSYYDMAEVLSDVNLLNDLKSGKNNLYMITVSDDNWGSDDITERKWDIWRQGDKFLYKYINSICTEER